MKMNEEHDMKQTTKITDGECVGHNICSHGFLRAYHGNTQIGSVSSACSAEELRAFRERIARDIETRLADGRSVTEFCGGFYAERV